MKNNPPLKTTKYGKNKKSKLSKSAKMKKK